MGPNEPNGRNGPNALNRRGPWAHGPGPWALLSAPSLFSYYKVICATTTLVANSKTTTDRTKNNYKTTRK